MIHKKEVNFKIYLTKIHIIKYQRTQINSVSILNKIY